MSGWANKIFECKPNVHINERSPTFGVVEHSDVLKSSPDHDPPSKYWGSDIHLSLAPQLIEFNWTEESFMACTLCLCRSSSYPVQLICSPGRNCLFPSTTSFECSPERRLRLSAPAAGDSGILPHPMIIFFPGSKPEVGCGRCCLSPISLPTHGLSVFPARIISRRR